MYPYQYTWFNLFGNFVDISKDFEVDYWGVSGKNIAKKINNNDKILYNKDKCIYVSPVHVVEPYISDDFNCVKPFFSIYPPYHYLKKNSIKFVSKVSTHNYPP